MKKVILLLTLLTLSAPSFAKGIGKFGLKDSIQFIQHVDIKGPEGEALYLSYHTQTRFFVAGVYTSDKGYVLSVRAKQQEGQTYYPLTDEMIADFQAKDLLPSPLPKYEIGTIGYLEGYSLWIFLAIAGIFIFFKKKNETE